MEQRPRHLVLDEVNTHLRTLGVPEWTDLKRIGRHRSNEYEILGVEDVVRETASYYARIVFLVQKPSGATGTYSVRFNLRPTALVVAVINDKLLMVNQHRLPLGKWSLEFPRGWLDLPWVHTPEAAIVCCLKEEVGDAWLASLRVTREPVCIGQLAEDSGVRGDVVPVYYLEGENQTDLPRSVRHHLPKLYGWERVWDMEADGTLACEKTLAALLKADRFRTRTCAAEGRNPASRS